MEKRGSTADPARWEEGQLRPGKASPVYGGLELATNNYRLLVAKAHRRNYRLVKSFSRIVGLMARHQVGHARSIATQACWRAANCGHFVEPVRDETGRALKLVPVDEEERLTLAGGPPLLDRRLPQALVFDTGGGSTELIWIEQSHRGRPRILDLPSTPAGVVTLAERCGRGTVPAEPYDRIAEEFVRGRVFLLGTSGTVATLGNLHLDLPRYDRSNVDGLTMDFKAIRTLSATLAPQDQAERAQHPCIGHDRTDLIVMGCTVLEAICRRWAVGQLRVADRGIREVLLLTMMGVAHPRRRWRPRRERPDHSQSTATVPAAHDPTWRP